MSEVFNNIQPKVSYTAPPVTNANKTEMTVADAIAAAPTQDTVQISKPKQERKGFVKSVNETIGNFKKFFASAETYTVAGFKGLATGVVIGSLAYSGGKLVNYIKKKSLRRVLKNEKVTKEVKKEAKTKLKKLVKNNKFIAAGAAALGVATLAGTLWKANLDLNEKKSNIEHRYVGHNQ